MSMKKNSAAVAAVVLAVILGNALAGLAAPIGYHAECTDGIDNNQDGFIDGDDQECLSYPWADGNGESPTEVLKYFESNDGYEFYSDYVGAYVFDPQVQAEQLCFIALVEDTPFQEGEQQRAIELILELDLSCGQVGP